MNYISHQDFQTFDYESLDVDYITINIDPITTYQRTRLTIYFQSLGFNAYQKQSEASRSRQDTNDNNSVKNKFEVCFILKVPYQKRIMQIQFYGVSGKEFYRFIKQNAIQWEKFTNPRLSRFDLVYRRISKSNDLISPRDFINFSYFESQEVHPSKNIKAEKKQDGLILKIGHRSNEKHYRVYSNPKNNLLRFEAEMKGNLIKDFQDLLITSSFQEDQFESKLAYQFFKHSFGLFSRFKQPSHLDWLFTRIRPYQFRQSSLEFSTHYINQIDYSLVKQKQHLITLLRLLTYLKKINYSTKRLRSQFRCYKFRFSDFLKYNNQHPNSYQVNKLKTFFELVKQNFVIESFSDHDYRMLVTIPEVFVFKSEQNILMVEIWIAEDLFDYLHPFLFSDLFFKKLTKHEFQVLF